jgi:hypothetical protein
MGAAGRPGDVGEWLREDAEEFRGGAARLDTEAVTAERLRTLEVLGAVVPLPPAAADDFGRVDSAEQLRTPEAWQEWLGEHTGRMAWAGDRQVPETNFMARAKPGEVTGGYVKSAATRDGLPLWEKVTG